MIRISTTILILLATVTLSARQYEVAESQYCALRIDSDGSFWWNLRRTSPENLPVKVTVYSGDESAEDLPSAAYLGHRLLEDLMDNPWLTVQVWVHPDAPAVSLDSLLLVFDEIERDLDDSVRHSIEDCPAWDLGSGAYSFRLGLSQFRDRDSRIMRATRDNLELPESVAAGIADRERFAEALVSGRWDQYRKLFETTFQAVADEDVLLDKVYAVDPEFPPRTAWRGCLTAFVYVNNCGIPDSANVSRQYWDEIIPEDVRMAVMEAVLKERYVPWSCKGVGYDRRAVVVRSCQEVVWDYYCYPTDGQPP